MKFVKTKTINGSANKIWQVTAVEFADIGKWMSGVVHSRANETAQLNNEAVAGRVCTFDTSDDPFMAIENITRFDEKNHILEFEVFPQKKSGAGLPIIKNSVVMSLETINDNTTVLHWQSQFELKWLGKLLSPLLRIKINGTFNDLLNDLKVYIETGRVSEKKRRYDEKLRLKMA